MVSGEALLVAIVAGGLIYGGVEAVKGVKWLGKSTAKVYHKVVRKR